jgi:hypothetical protein
MGPFGPDPSIHLSRVRSTPGQMPRFTHLDRSSYLAPESIRSSTGTDRARIRRRIRLLRSLHATTCDNMPQKSGEWRAGGPVSRGGGSRVENAASAISGISVGNYETEREGFEPSVGLLPHRFSRPARSATPAPLQLLWKPLKAILRTTQPISNPTD